MSLWLAASKRERTLLSGVLTIVASCGLMGVLRVSPGVPMLTATEAAEMAAVTLYFIGTVLHVKALIRERNDPHSATRSLVYHGPSPPWWSRPPPWVGWRGPGSSGRSHWLRGRGGCRGRSGPRCRSASWRSWPRWRS
ncbi:hypothetical protein G7085_12930 [Tessaracoccus sp. HDW20]|nr:hypothetical protein [Tessaracoccus coleopterorum]NHB85226.1 hypothetical protein [Tessaracoccus coleopterorum]